jgi:hypothetical protein
MSPVHGLTITPKNPTANRQFSYSYKIGEKRGFRVAAGAWTFLRPEGAFYPSPGPKAWVRKSSGWRVGSPERAPQTTGYAAIAFQRSKITIATPGTESTVRAPFQGLALPGHSRRPWALPHKRQLELTLPRGPDRGPTMSSRR